MSIPQITEAEMTAKGVVSLPTRPNNPYAYGGENLSASELKERFDRLPRLIAERLNLLLGAVAACPVPEDLSGGSLAELLLTGMFPQERASHTLAELFADIMNGTLTTYLIATDGMTLEEVLRQKAEMARVVFDAGEALTPEDGREYRYGEITALSISLPLYPSELFSATVIFRSAAGNGTLSLDYPDGILWSGDDIVDGVFLPFGSKHYTVLFWYDGAWHGAVRGVAL